MGYWIEDRKLFITFATFKEQNGIGQVISINVVGGNNYIGKKPSLMNYSNIFGESSKRSVYRNDYHLD